MAEQDNNTPIIAWEEPEPLAHVTEWDTLVNALRERPGQWGKMKHYSSDNGAQTKAGDLRKKHKDCEFTTRVDRVEGGRWLYGRALPQTDVQVEG